MRFSVFGSAQKAHRMKQTFTLLEMMIALVVLGLMAAAMGWHIQGLIAHHRFQSEVGGICLAFQEAQTISIIHQTECELVIMIKDNQLQYQLNSDEPLTILDRSIKPLKASQFMTIDHVKTGKAVFRILSSGRIEPTAILGLHQEDPSLPESQGLWVDLQTPIQIKLMQKKPQRLVKETYPQKPKTQKISPF